MAFINHIHKDFPVRCAYWKCLGASRTSWWSAL